MGLLGALVRSNKQVIFISRKIAEDFPILVKDTKVIISRNKKTNL